MKHKTFNKLYGWLAAASLLLATSCVDDTVGSDWNGSDEVDVTFMLAPEGASATRAEGDAEADAHPERHISDGTKADMLIYAIYDKDGNQLHEGYGKGIDPELAKLGFKASPGQTVMKIDEFPCPVTIRLKRGVEYQVAFWAQSRQTHAYITSDLRKVEVNYNIVREETNSTPGSGTQGAATEEEGDNDDPTTTKPNNDERRDAFCRSVRLVAGQNGNVARNIYLYRPLAQINIGTRGYDYEIATRTMTKKYTYSKIRINRVARYLDIVDDKIVSSTTSTEESDEEGKLIKTNEAFVVVDFDYAPFPAYEYMKLDEKTKSNVPLYPSYTSWDWVYNPNFQHPAEKGADDYANEEFLRLHIDDYVTPQEDPNLPPRDKDGYLGYTNLNDYNDVKETETFKYLSMSYVLTSSTKEEAIVINNVKVWLATDAQGSDEYLLLDIDHVPAQRNWRTNIVGNLLTEEMDFTVTLDKDFAGEYNGIIEGDGARWSGPLAEGVYYDGKNDEIQISSAQGLLWFQKMVNGDLKVRTFRSDEKTIDNTKGQQYLFTYLNGGGTAAKANDPYIYYPGGSSNSKEFEYDGYPAPNDPELLARILYATHQDLNTSVYDIYDTNTHKDGWPEAKNFHFVGDVTKRKNGDTRKAQATVKLMADIDLSELKEKWIPIGFDGRIAETVRKTFEEREASNRGFYGIFDGNGHTISNMTTQRFTAQVPDAFQQSESYGSYDVPQWFARGLFGMIGGEAKVKNVRLLAVDVYGCQCVGAVVGAAQGGAIEITNCIVDGGSLIVTPMYRGDSRKEKKDQNRTYARGVYLGGIVGYFKTKGGSVTGCEVRNLFMQGYRRVGGIVGSINQYLIDPKNPVEKDKTDNALLTDFRADSVYQPKEITNNSISNTVLLASQFTPFGMATPEIWYNKLKADIIPIGFGWGSGIYDLYANAYVGGYKEEQFPVNSQSGLTFAEITESDDPKTGRRKANLQSLPLHHMPMLSAWFADSISLHANYYGTPSAYTRQGLKDFKPFSKEPDRTGTINIGENGNNTGGTKFKYPLDLPGGLEVLWETNERDCHRAGIYVGSVQLSGRKSIGGRSVITPTGLSGEGDCVMYVCPENRFQFNNEPMKYKVSTVLSNLVIRGNPYAYTGVLLSPNKNGDVIRLDTVAIYDVYQTLALDTPTSLSENVWPNTSDGKNDGKNDGSVALELNGCNLRGYTVPGGNWKSISYNGTTFERGASTGHGREEYTLKVETSSAEAATVKFTDCYFKAPYIIDLTDADLKKVSFTNCEAAAATRANVEIAKDLTVYKGLVKIRIRSDSQGNPEVHYLDNDGNDIIPKTTTGRE